MLRCESRTGMIPRIIRSVCNGWQSSQDNERDSVNPQQRKWEILTDSTLQLALLACKLGEDNREEETPLATGLERSWVKISSSLDGVAVQLQSAIHGLKIPLKAIFFPFVWH